MKHDALIAPDESQFAFTPKISSLATLAGSEGGSEFVTVPDAHLLFSGDFKRSGDDLKIVGDDGKSVLISDYFKNDKRPTLLSPEGAAINGDVVDMLAGPLAPGQYAQAGAPQPGAAEAVGRVAVVTGNVTVIRNGVAITVNAGDVILKNDVVQTGANSTLGLALNDGSTFNLTANARLAINDFVYDPNGSANSSLVTLLQGAATFVAGQIAKTGDMKVATPVATMGIRGTAVILDINSVDGRVSISVIDQRDNQTHTVEVFDRAGNLIGTATSIGGQLFLTPTATFEVIASFTNKTPEQVAIEFAAFQAVLSSYEAAKQFFPNLPDHTDLNPKGTQHAEGSGTPPPAEKSGSLPDSITQNLQLPDVVFTKAIESPGTGDGDNSTDDGTPTVVETVFTPPALNPISGSGEINGTDGADYITGSNTPDTINAMGGNDFVFAFGDNDVIIAGHGGGDDYYDGGDGEDLLEFPSADASQPLVFHLRGIGAPNNTVDGPLTGHDIFTNIERIESGAGDDIFYLYDTSNWYLDAGGGIDIIRLVGDLDINGDTEGPDAKNFEIIDLRNDGGQNTIGFEGGGLDESDNKTIRILGEDGDIVNLVDHFGDETDGHWVLVSESPVLDPFDDDYSNDIYFYQYQFVDGEQVLTAYVQDTITVNANEGPDAGDVTLRVNALGNGGFESTPDFDGWTTDLDTSDNTSSTVFSTAVIDRSGTVITGDDAVAVLSFGAWVEEAGDTGYGPSITSDPFFGYEGDTVRFVWQLSSGGDWATGFGYIVDTNTDEIVQVVFDYQNPFTGSTGVQTTDIALDYSGEFELVFRVGSYDWTHGMYIGAELDLGYAGVLQTGVPEDLSVTFTDSDLLANSSDPDNDNLILSAVSTMSALGAIVTLNENGSVTYGPSAAPDIQSLAAGETATDTFTFTISDGNGHFDTATATLTVLGANDAPVVDSHDAEVGYTLGDPGVAVDSVITLSDIDSDTLHGAKITIDNFSDGDTLIFADAGNISGSFDSQTGVLTLTGDDTVENYQLALRSISYQNLSGTAGDRTISYQVDDGTDTSTVETSTIHVDAGGGAPNEAPVIGVENAETSEQGSSTTLSRLFVSDADANGEDEFHVTIVAEHGTLSMVNAELNGHDVDESANGMEFYVSLDNINAGLLEGITYTDPATDENDTDTVTLTVDDQNGGIDTINFIFNIFGQDEIPLSGTGGKDVLFATGNDDTLSGGASADIFVFSFADFNGGSDSITDFDISEDMILFDQVPAGFDTFEELQKRITYEDGVATINLDQSGQIDVTIVQGQELLASNFIFHSVLV